MMMAERPTTRDVALVSYLISHSNQDYQPYSQFDFDQADDPFDESYNCILGSQPLQSPQESVGSAGSDETGVGVDVNDSSFDDESEQLMQAQPLPSEVSAAFEGQEEQTADAASHSESMEVSQLAKPDTASTKRKRGRPKGETLATEGETQVDQAANATPVLEETSETPQTESSASSEVAASSSAAAPTKKGAGNGKKPTKDTYYCKHCDTNFPVGYFRNVQQFGAHCSNCSRGRSIQTPDDTYASRLPTRLQRALKRKKRQEENGGVPRKRGRKAAKPKAAPKPKAPKQKRQRVQPRSEGLELESRRRERRSVPEYDEAYVYHYYDRRHVKTPRRRDWEEMESRRVKRRHLVQRLEYMPMSVNNMDELPQKLLLRIFSFLDAAGDLAKVGMACKLFARIYNHDSLWKRLFCKQWGESLGYAFVGNWKGRYKARIEYIRSRRKPEFLPSLRLDSQSAIMPSAESANPSDGSFCSLPSVKSTPLPSHGHWLAERIVDSQPKIDPISGQSKMEYLIKWEGFGDDWNSWINEEDVWCKELIEEYTSGKIIVPPSQKARNMNKRMRHSTGDYPWGHNDDDDDESMEDWYIGARRKTANLAGWGGGKGHLFSSGIADDDYSSLWDLDMDEDLWRDTWDTGGSSMMSDDEEEEDYEDVPVTKEEKEKQQTEFLRALEANANYKPVILFFEKS